MNLLGASIEEHPYLTLEVKVRCSEGAVHNQFEQRTFSEEVMKWAYLKMPDLSLPRTLV